MYRFMKILSFLICHLPVSWQQALGRGMGVFFWTFVPKRRKVLAQKQILDCKLTDSPAEAMAIAKASSLRFGPMIVEVLTYPNLVKKGFFEKFTVTGKEYLDRLKESGEGAVIMASHAGNWELLGAWLAMSDYPVISVAQQQSSGSDEFINEYRTMLKQHVTYKTGIRDMLRFLGEGKYIGLLMDQDPGYTGLNVKLFGRDTLTADGPAKMAAMKNYGIYPVFIHEDRPYHHHIEIQAPLHVFEEGETLSKEEKKQRIYEVTQKLNDILEAHIRKYPSDWFWLHNRWKWTNRLAEKEKAEGNK